MARGGKKINKREIQPDLKYHDVRVAKFINYLMIGGKKSIAEAIVYDAFEKIEKETKKNPVLIFEQALKNVGPLLEVKPIRIGGATYQVPYEVPPVRQFTLGAKWIIEAARKKQGKSMASFLAEEILDAYNNQGAAVKRKLDIHRTAEANRAFAHYARF